MRTLTSLLLCLGACTSDPLANGGFDIDCGGTPCDWTVTQGTADLTHSWHEGDPGADLSGTGRVVVEQRSAPLTFWGASRTWLLEASMVRDAGATLAFELDWYSGSGAGASYWNGAPKLLYARSVSVAPAGVFRWRQLVDVPTLEANGLIFEIVKDGSGRAVVDEISLEPYREPAR